MFALWCASILLGSSSSNPLPQLHVSGNQILDRSNKPVRLRGVNCAGMEWSKDGEGHIEKTVEVAVHDWKANLVRIPLSEDRWFGKTSSQTDGGTSYRALVGKVIEEANSNGCYVLLDLHWNDADEWGKNIGQHKMPDQNSLAFWKECAAEYRNRSGVLFDLYNEPHDVSWELWMKGGEIEEPQDKGAALKYRAPGMQEMLETIRATGAKNVVVCGGLDWAYDLSGFLNGYQLKDPKGHGVIYACHNYPVKGDSIEKWTAKMDAALPKIPVIMSEFGADPKGKDLETPTKWVQQVLKVASDRKMNYTAWDLHPAASPCLIKGWDYEPTSYFGVLVKRDLAAKQ